MNFNHNNLNSASGAYNTLLSKRGMAAKAAAFLCILAVMLVCGILVGKEANIAQAAAYSAEEVQEMYDTLPTAAEVDAMDNAGQNEVYALLNTCYDAWLELTEDEQEAIGDAKFEELFEYFASGVMPVSYTANFYFTYPSGAATGLYDSVNSGTVGNDAVSPSLTTVKGDGGYVFVGWVYASSSTTPTSVYYTTSVSNYIAPGANISTYGGSISGNSNWVSVWAPVSIVYDTDGGSSITSNYLKDGISTTTPTKTNYTFSHWEYANASGYAASFTFSPGDSLLSSGWTTALDDSSDLYCTSVTLKAVWTYSGSSSTTTYKVTYSYSGSTSVYYSSSVTSGNSVTLRGSTYSRSGYTQSGWSINGTTYSLSSSYTVTGNVTATPTWTANSYTITYYSNGGTGSMNTTTATYGSSVTLRTNSFTRSGYTFSGWNTSSDGSGTSYSDGKTWSSWSMTSNLYLYAQWSANTYTVTFNKNTTDTTYSGSYTSKTMTYNSTSNNSLSVPTRTGYTFSGWYTASSGGTAVWGSGGSYNSSATSYWSSGKWIYTSNRTVYAHWTANTYSVVFNGNGSTSGSMSDESMTYDSSKKLTANSYSKTGYHFLGWSKSSTAKVATYTDQESVLNLATSGTVTLYAVWEANTYYIEYLAPDATAGEMSTQEATYDANVTLLKNAYRRNGYTFKGWSTTNGATSATYTDGQTIAKANLTDVNGGTAKLYAVWQANSATIVYDANGGTGAPANQTKYVDTALKISSTKPTRTGYTFKGWSTSEDSSIVSYTAGQTITEEFSYSDGNTYTFYAVWVKADSNFDLTNVIDDTHMFYGDGFLTGGSGTEYDDSHIDSEYARIDGGNPAFCLCRYWHFHVLTAFAGG